MAPRLEPLLGLVRLRIVHCTVDAGLAATRVRERAHDNPLRRAHADLGPDSAIPRTFTRVSLGPALEVDTTDGYRPSLDQIVAFINGPVPDGTDGA